MSGRNYYSSLFKREPGAGGGGFRLRPRRRLRHAIAGEKMPAGRKKAHRWGTGGLSAFDSTGNRFRHRVDDSQPFVASHWAVHLEVVVPRYVMTGDDGMVRALPLLGGNVCFTPERAPGKAGLAPGLSTS